MAMQWREWNLPRHSGAPRSDEPGIHHASTKSSALLDSGLAGFARAPE
jgi:hypothetical protein